MTSEKSEVGQQNGTKHRGFAHELGHRKRGTDVAGVIERYLWTCESEENHRVEIARLSGRAQEEVRLRDVARAVTAA